MAERRRRRRSNSASPRKNRPRSSKKPIFGSDNHYGYRLLEQIGSGSFGVVYLAERRKDKKQVAIKCVSVGMDEDARRELKALRNEVQILRACNDPFVVKYHESFMVQKMRSEETWIVMEFCDFGTLENLRKMEGGYVTDVRLIRIVIAGVTLGLLYLHSKKMIHRDIKGGNVLLSLSGGCKLADFGVSAQMSNTTLVRSTLTGTPMFMAPEVIQQKPYTEAADVWSLGILFYEMLEGELPFSHFKNPMTAMMRIPYMKAPRLPESERYDPQIINFINNCLQKKPPDRMGTMRLSEHPLVHSYVRELRRNKGVSPYLGKYLQGKIKDMMEKRRRERSSSDSFDHDAGTPPPPPPEEPPTMFTTSPPPPFSPKAPSPPPPPSPPPENATMIGPDVGTFGDMFGTTTTKSSNDATFIAHAGSHAGAHVGDTMSAQCSDTMIEADARSVHSSLGELKYSGNGSFKSNKSSKSSKSSSSKGMKSNSSKRSAPAVAVPPPSPRSAGIINFAKLKNPILVKGQSSVTKVAHLLNTVSSNLIKIGKTACVVVYSERKKGFYTCDRGPDGKWGAGHRCRVRKDAQLIQVYLDTA